MDLFANVKTKPVSSSLIAPLRSMQLAVYQEGDSTPFHSTSYFHAIIAFSGDMVFQERGKAEFHCRKGSFLAIPPGTLYKWRVIKDATLLQGFHAPFSFLEHRGMANLFGTSNRHIRNFDLGSKTMQAFSAAYEADMREREPAKGLKLSADFLKLMVESATIFNADGSSTHPALAKAISHLAENAERSISLESLAKKSGLGVSRISQLFREEVGISPLRYHARLKAERATALLLAHELSMDEIAERLGFASTCAFRHFYRKTAGVPPGHAANRKSRR